MSAENKNVWERIVSELLNNGIKAYPPATKKQQCAEKYVVVKYSGSHQAMNYSTQKDYYDFYLYVPKNDYSILADFEAEVKSVLDKPPLYPMIMPTGQSENDYYDDNINAHLRSFTYYNYKRVKHL